MYKGKKVIVVVPAYNEVKQIIMMIEGVPDFVDLIIVIDDASSDETSNVVQAHKHYLNGRVKLIAHEFNQGVGGAIASGYKWSRDNQFDIAVVMAGDGQMDPKDLPALLDPVVKNLVDFSKGNRLAVEGAFKKIPKIRFFGNHVLSFFTKIASGYWFVSDSQTGYTAINKKALQIIDWEAMYKRYGQPNDLLVRLNVADMRVADVPIAPVYGIGEKSGIKIHKVIFTIGFLLLRLFFWRLKEKYLLRNSYLVLFLYALGILGLLISAILFVPVTYFWLDSGHVHEPALLTILSIFATGLSSCFFAMWFDSMKSRHLNPVLKSMSGN